MVKKWMRFVLREQAGEGDAGGGGGAPADGAGDNDDPGAGAGGDPAPTAAPTSAPSAAPTAAPSGAPTQAPTAAPGKPGDAESKGDWPDDWQNKLAGGDEKLLKKLQRYASPKAMADALVAAQARISSGELKPVLSKDAKPEEVAAWRKENGIPETPEKYDLKFDSGLVIGDDDKPIIDGYLKAAHDRNMTPDQVKAGIEWYYDEVKRQADVQNEKDETDRQAALDALNAEWGGNFRRNHNMVNGLLDRFPEKVRDLFKGGRLADGTAIMNNPDVIRSLAGIALEINPAGQIVPTGSGDPMKSVEGRIEEIEATMRKDRNAYNKNEKLQAEYRELLGAREKLKERQSA